MYLDRPVFPLPIDYAKAWSGSFQFDLRERQVGAGAPEHLGEQAHQVRRLDVRAVLGGGASLLDLELFFEQVRGRSVGFWLPLVHQSMRVVEGLERSTFRVAGTELASRWNLTPRAHLHVVGPDLSSYQRAIAQVVQDGDDCLVTLSSPLPSVPSPAWSVSLLPYVRLGSDELELRSLAPDVMEADFSCVELPLEYESAAADQTRIKLFELGYRVGANSAWARMTSFGVQVRGTDGLLWDSRPIEHGDISEDSDGAKVSLKAIAWDDCPLLDLLPWSKGLPLSVRIFEGGWDWAAFRESGQRRLLFDGQVKKVSRQGREIAATCQSGIDLYTRQVPSRVFSRQCQAAFCDVACGLSRADFELEATAGAQSVGSGYYIDVQCPALAPLGLDWLALGSIYSAAYRNGIPSRQWETRPILGATDLGGGSYRLQIRQPFRWLEPGAACYLFSGCPRTPGACKARVRADGGAVNNYANYWGHPHVPLRNPQTDMLIDTALTGKKGK